jgi:hypothetical protein
MSKMVQEVKEKRLSQKLKKVVNFMGGTSYEINPIDTLKMITASSIFGEPQYYRGGEFEGSELSKIVDGVFSVHALFKPFSIFNSEFEELKTSTIMEKVIDEALSFDFEATLDWAVELRHNFYMRLNPQIIMVRAAMHPDREKYTKLNPGQFAEINNRVMSRADEPASQLSYWLYKNKKKNNMPSLLKRSWAKRISIMGKYELGKYKNAGLGMIDVVRISHAKNPLIDELMKTGTVQVDEDNWTWESMRSAKKTWREIITSINLNTMALLRNLRNIFEEINDLEICNKLMIQLKGGVLKGKQFPFRYFSAMKAIKESSVNHKQTILDALEECVDIARENMPKLNGRTMCLSDNSGSAWGAVTSEYGSMTIAEIDNLSSVITAQNCEEGFVGKFGDKLKVFPISKRNGALSQANQVTAQKSEDVGGGTENGVWLFFDNAIKTKEHWDNIFIYSDQQAGHGGLYGTNAIDYIKYSSGRYIDVMKLIDAYRKTVNPKVNVFAVQTAGYDNVVIPEYGYRTNILFGWTGKELVFADEMIKFWDQKDSQHTEQ